MDLRKQIGQLLFVGFQGKSITAELKELIEDYHIGGIIFFTRNIEDVFQLSDLIYEAQSLARKKPDGIPLLVGIDQEGGRVARIKEPLTVFPPASVLGRTRSEELACRQGMVQAIELKALGFNINFSPVLDIDTNSENPIIGDRSFGNAPKLVSMMGRAVIRGLQENGVIACGKHFPGHGDASVDSHLELPILNHDVERLMALELRPFKAAIREQVETMMTAHIHFPKIDIEKIPATFSRKIIKGLLRKKLRFKGVIFSDDLEMKAVENNFSMENAALSSIEAGVDMLLVCHSPEKQVRIFEALLGKVYKGEISKTSVTEANKRIFNLKKRYIGGLEKPDRKKLLKILGNEEHKKIAFEIAGF